MEVLLEQIHQEQQNSGQKPPPRWNADSSTKVHSALQALAVALRDIQPLLQQQQQQQQSTTSAAAAADNGSTISAAWLRETLARVPSELDVAFMAQQVWEIATSVSDSGAQQEALFNILGASEEAVAALFDIVPHMNQIAVRLNASDFAATTTASFLDTSTTVDLEEERRQFLLHEAMEAVQTASLAKAEAQALTGGATASSPFGATHTVGRTSAKNAVKTAEKAEKRAQQALQRAKDAGAIVDEENWLQVDGTGYGQGGLVGLSHDQLRHVREELLPEGSRHYYDHKTGLPKGAVREDGEDYDKVYIPPPRRDESQLPPRLRLADILDEEERIAFAGTTSLNPMQSTVFETAFHSRLSLLILAPTGAGKTNVAMLTVVAHLRDVGLLRPNHEGLRTVEAGKKIVYIAPMKALAQEVVEKFSSKLKPLGLIVRELTGDMQLSRAETESANIIVTTPEKWDVVTRKSGNDDNSLGNKCGLLIIDEVHLLADDRGAVIESVVARLHRLVESRQRQIRIVALSATLPNYQDVADFLRVPPRGVFFFGPEHRPVPLEQNFYGVHVPPRDRDKKEERMNQICFDVVVDSLRRGYQVMVFVHSRKGTGDTASAMAEIAAKEKVLEKYFVTQGKEGPLGEANKRYADRVKKSRSREVGVHFENGIGIHHAGMLRADRKLTEQMFMDGAIRLLCCTATLAWGVNLPVHSVVVKGTDVYNPEKGGLVDLSILDVQQIFGRAGRPQFDTRGEATLITTADAFPRYMDKLVRAAPIESNFIKQLADHFNAEIVGGTVSTIREGVEWLTYTYLYTRMLRNPLAYGIRADEREDDPMLRKRCTEEITNAAKLLAVNNMITFTPQAGNVAVQAKGRVAAHYYIQAESVSSFNDMLEMFESYSDEFLLRLISSATEFSNMKIRQEELSELTELHEQCPIKLQGAGLEGGGHSMITGPRDKVFVLMQTYISRGKIRSFTLISDMNYVASNAGRIARSIFEMCLSDTQNNKSGAALKLMRIAKSVDNQSWWFHSPLRSFEGEIARNQIIALETYHGNQGYNSMATCLSLLDLEGREVAAIAKSREGGGKIKRFVKMLPNLEISCQVRPVSSGVVSFHIEITPTFEWNRRWHGGAQSFWLWIENGDNSIFHRETILLSMKNFPEITSLDPWIPVFDQFTDQYTIRVVSDSWVGVEFMLPVRLNEIKILTKKTPITELQDLTPLPVTALQNVKYEALYSRFETFNPIQTQLFHILYHTEYPVFLGAPTGSGKTIVSELAILRMKRIDPKGICVYLAPLKSLARERLKEWKKRFGDSLGWSVLELSGDTSHDQQALERGDILICTPEKWDLITRGWRGTAEVFGDSGASNGKAFIKRIRLLVIDEIHLVGEERGAVLEAIVSRTRFISRLQMEEANQSDKKSSNLATTRIIGLSTSLENALDLADWIGVDTTSSGPRALRGMYNFRDAVRPVPLTVHVQGFTGRHYCPRMATMNKPCFAAIKDHSPQKPALIFVASRRQTRLTAFDIISYAAAEDNPKRFLGCPEEYIESVAAQIKDDALRHTIAFGIGLHHAGLSSHDRDIVERLYLKNEIQILVATATLAWGVNLPAHLVIVKGTEFFDGKTSRYEDYPLTDVLQMIGRAGRPGFDSEGVAVVMSTEEKKVFYKKFLLNRPFPLESCMEGRLCENVNAEIASGTIHSDVEAIGYLSWTFYARRVKGNPSYYGAESESDSDIEKHFASVIDRTLNKLESEGCILLDKTDDVGSLSATCLGIASCTYYLDHRTPKQMQFGVREGRKLILAALSEQEGGGMDGEKYSAEMIPITQSAHVDELSCAWLFYTLCCTHEFDELPVRHNEEILNEELSGELMWGPDTQGLLSGEREVYHDAEVYLDPHTKAFLLLQAFLEHARLPISDYINDTKSVTDNVPRLFAAMEYIAGEDASTAGTFDLLTQFARASQIFESRSLPYTDPLSQLGFSESIIHRIKTADKKKNGLTSLWDMRRSQKNDVTSMLRRVNSDRKKFNIEKTIEVLYSMPSVRVAKVEASSEVDKANVKTTGRLRLELEIERRSQNSSSDQAMTLIILVGSVQQKLLLSKSSVRFTRNGKWNVKRTVTFDWNIAKAEGERVLVRLLWKEVRGLDSQFAAKLS